MKKTVATFASLGIITVLLCSGFVALPTAQAFANGEAATIVIGQTNFTTSSSGDTQSTLKDPQGIAFDSAGNLWVADAANGRVLEFKAPLSTGESASLVLGEANFTASDISCLGSTVITSSCLATPEGIAFDSKGDLWVADGGTYRVLEFTPPFTNDENASVALGQPNLTTGGTGDTPTASSLNQPEGIGFDGSGNLWVTDTLDNRVLEFKAPLSTGEAASVVLGQTNFTSAADGALPAGCQTACPTASSLTAPDGVTVDSSGNVWTSERGTGRILEFKAPISTGESASLVLGQAKFTTYQNGGGFYCTVVTPAQYCVEPDSITFDKSGNAWVADTGYWRVLSFSAPFKTNETASTVIGFDNFTAIAAPSGQQNATASNMINPESVAIDSSGNVWVSDDGQNRVLEFPASATGGATSSSLSTTVSVSSPSSTSLSSSQLQTSTGPLSTISSSTQHSTSTTSASSPSLSSAASSTTTTSNASALSFSYVTTVISAVIVVMLALGMSVIRRRRT